MNTLAFRADSWMPVSRPDVPTPITPTPVVTLSSERVVTVNGGLVVEDAVPRELVDAVLDWCRLGEGDWTR